MNEAIQVYDGNGTSPFPTTFDDAYAALKGQWSPFMTLDLGAARVTRGSENIRYNSLYKIVYEGVRWPENKELKAEVRHVGWKHTKHTMDQIEAMKDGMLIHILIEMLHLRYVSNHTAQAVDPMPKYNQNNPNRLNSPPAKPVPGDVWNTPDGQMHICLPNGLVAPLGGLKP